MITGFQEWATQSSTLQKWPFSSLEGRGIAIDAETYVDKILSGESTKEPLLPALGGLPFLIESTLSDHIEQLRAAKIKVVFVFNGQGTNDQHKALQTALRHSKNVDEAWNLYNASDPEKAVAQFGNSCTFQVDHIYRYVQKLLFENNVDFLVAPYSASAQLAQMEISNFADAVFGSSEVLMFEVEKVILDLDFTTKEFTGVFRRTCIENLTPGSSTLFLDACLLAGSSFLPTLPQLDAEIGSPSKTPKIKAAAELLKRSSLTGDQICIQNQDDLAAQALKYSDSFRKAFMSVKHHVVMSNNKIEPLRKDSIPNDVHSFVGQRLPDELFTYQSRGIVGTRVLAWRTASEIIETPPLDGGESITYKMLVRDQLVPQRLQALSLLSYSLHRFYQHNSVTLRCWFEMGQSKTLSITDAADLKTTISDWNVRLEAISTKAKTLEQNASSLAFAIESLRDSDFAKKTITPRKNGYTPLTSAEEISANSLWRFLSLRGYIASDHTLTPLGKCLAEAYSQCKLLKGTYEEAVFVAIELLRLKLLNADNLFPVPPYHGAPYRGSTSDQRNTLLVSRIACLGHLKHKVIGYTGPLSRHLLAYQSVISAVRGSQRDILEMTMCTLLLSGNVDRKVELEELQKPAFSLPFLRDADCALGIAVKHYLDELSAQTEQPLSAPVRDSVKDKGAKSWFPHAEAFEESLTGAFHLWDAVYAAVKVAPEEVASKTIKQEWAAVDKWLEERK